MLRIVWDAWRAYARRAGQYQKRVWLTVVYVVILGPVALAARLGWIQLMDFEGRGWIVRPPLDNSMDALRRQF
ncbi:MAG: hypothetical protein NVSMB2_19220 [Chloroflexota bacterium]